MTRAPRRWQRAVRWSPAAVGLLLAAVVAWLPEPAAASSFVQPLTGNYVYGHTDIAYAAEGTRVELRRAYNSAIGRATALGFGWSDNLSMGLARYDKNPSDLLVIGPDDGTVHFRHAPDGTYSPPPEYPGASLVHEPDNTWVATQQDGAVWTFDDSGMLQRVRDASGATFVLNWGTHGLKSLRLPDGRAVLTFAVDPTTQRVLSVTDVPDPAAGPTAPRSVQFAYDTFGRLVTATDRDGQVTRYGYDGVGPRLTSITDALGHVAMTVAYDAQDQVASQTDARGRYTGWSTTFRYTTHSDGTRVAEQRNPPSGWAPDWQPTVRRVYNARGWQIEQTTVSGPTDTPLTIRFNYLPGDPSGQDPVVVRSGGATPIPAGAVPIRDPWGGQLPLIGDRDHPLPLPGCPPVPPPPAHPEDLTNGWPSLATLEPRTELWRRFPGLASQPLAQHQDAFGRTDWEPLATGEVWSFAYDNEDRLLRADLSTLLPGGPSASTQLHYDAVGNVTEVDWPGGTVDSFRYDERDRLVRARWDSGAVARYLYDDGGDLLQARYQPADGSPELVVDYRFDGLHRPREVVTAERTVLYGYDDAGTCTTYAAP